MIKYMDFTKPSAADSHDAIHMVKGMASMVNTVHTDTLPKYTIINTHKTRLRNELVLLSTIFLTLLQNCKQKRREEKVELLFNDLICISYAVNTLCV